MGFNKIHINREKIISSFKSDGAQGVADMFLRYDGIILESNCNICHYIEKIMSKEETVEYRKNLIEVYMLQLLEGLYKIN
tara:strand:+ start:280 stop:519 length:240 start_codon:yes stop_codon:yes gene_type:complete